MIGLLTSAERDAIQRAADLWNALCATVPEGPTRDADLRELAVHIHAIQHAVMANAAARAYPDTYRLLGGTLRHMTGDGSGAAVDVPGAAGLSEAQGVAEMRAGGAGL